MPKITNQAGLTSNNLVLHTVELAQRSTISITAGTATIADSAAEFISAGFQVGDRINIRFASPTNPNNGFATIDTLLAGSITVTDATGTLTDQAAGLPCVISRLKKTFEFVEVDELNFQDGVEGAALASELQTLWNNGSFDTYPFPYNELRPDAETLVFIEGWEHHNENTLNAIRDTAIRILDGETGSLAREFMNVQTAAPFVGGTGVARFWQQDPSTTPATPIVPFFTNGYVNQLVEIFRAGPGGFDYRNFFTAKIAEPGRTPVVYDLITEGNNAVLTAKPYSLLLGDQIDIKLADNAGTPLVDDNTIDTQEPYTNITWSRFTTDQARDIDGSNFNFREIIARTGATAQQVHQKLNRLVRDWENNIDSGVGTLRGGFSPALSSFLGETITYQGFTDGLPNAEKNTSIFIDGGGNARSFLRVGAFSLDYRAPANFTGSTNFKVVQQSVFGIQNAPALQDADGNDATGTIQDSEFSNGSLVKDFSVAYETFDQNGHPPNTDIPILVSVGGGATNTRPGTFGPFIIRNNTTQSFVINLDETTAWRPEV